MRGWRKTVLTRIVVTGVFLQQQYDVSITRSCVLLF